MKLATMRPVARLSAEAQVTDSLREFILSGAVPPGGRVTEIALAEHLGVARATLRTGLHRLASEGLLTQTPYTGWHVSALTADDVWELWTLRASLESLAARLAAESSERAREQVAATFEALKQACAAGRPAAIAECDYALHRAIVAASGHSRLEQQYRLVEQQVRLTIASSNALVEEGPDTIIEQHRPMVDAIVAGDADAAAAAAWRHNEDEGKKLAASLRVTA